MPNLKQYKPQLILELSGKDFRKGYSMHEYEMVGGVFREATNFDPFEQIGFITPSIAPTQRGAGVINETPVQLTLVNKSSTPYFYCHTATKVFEINALTGGNVADISAQFWAIGVHDAIVWKNRYIYSTDGEIRSNTIPAVKSSDVVILSAGVDNYKHYFAIGADGNLYFTNGRYIGKCVSETSTTGNNAQQFDMGTGYMSRGLLNDGRYLVIIGDTNSATSPAVSASNPVVGFWNLSVASTTYEQLYTNTHFSDAYLIGGGVTRDGIYIFGSDNIYFCNLYTPPRIIWPMKGNTLISSLPSSQAVIKNWKGCILWGGADSSLYALGNPIPNETPILFQPYTATAGGITAIGVNGYSVWAGTNTPALYDFALGTTRNQSVIWTANYPLKQPYKFSHAKVILSSKLSSGQSVNFKALSLAGNGVVSDLDTVSYDSSNPRQELIFYRKPAGTSTDVVTFNELYSIQLTLYGGASVQKVEIWGYPQDPISFNI